MPSPRDALRTRARQTPDRRAYVFLDDHGVEAATRTYGELLAQARAVAAELSAQAQPGDRALLVFAPGLDFLTAFFGCLEAGVVAVPVAPPRRGRVQDATARVVSDADPAVVLTDALTVPTLAEALAPDRPRVVVGEDRAADEPPPCEGLVDPSAPAFLQYTSGSTSAPKGVIVTHGNLAANEEMMERAFGHDQNATMVGWTPLFHDQGLICNALQPLHLGTPGVLMAPRTFIRRPLIWPETISRYRATTSGGPDFAFAACVAAAEHSGLPAGMDLTGWTVAFDGAEPIRASTMRRFAEVFGPAGFAPQALYPCYGLAEGTLMVTGSRAGRGPRLFDADPDALAFGRLSPAEPGRSARTLVGSGEAAPGGQVRIVDSDTGRECAEGEVGEVRVSGGHVTAGYWQRPDATAATFPTAPDGRRELRTGDLGALIDDELYVLGRRSDLIVVRGRNHHPEDLEATVAAAHPALGGAGLATVAAFGLPTASPTPAPGRPAHDPQQPVGPNQAAATPGPPRVDTLKRGPREARSDLLWVVQGVEHGVDATGTMNSFSSFTGESPESWGAGWWPSEVGGRPNPGGEQAGEHQSGEPGEGIDGLLAVTTPSTMTSTNDASTAQANSPKPKAGVSDPPGADNCQTPGP